jgi:hypothetical protein
MPLREHRDRDHTPNGAAKLPVLADRVHGLAQQFLVGDVLTGTGIARALHDITAEALDLVSRQATKLSSSVLRQPACAGLGHANTQPLIPPAGSDVLNHNLNRTGGVNFGGP